MDRSPVSARILIVEDEPDIRELLHTVLSLAGYATAQAENGRVGLQRMLEFRPDLVLLDLEMPDIDGLGFLQGKSKQLEFRHTPVIVLSAKSRTPDVMQAINMGADNYIAKPFDLCVVLENVQRLARPRPGGTVGLT
jgi:DNA-binding response OmpR family regulator